MSTIDQLNDRYGRSAIALASTGQSGGKRRWSMNQSLKTPDYTTRWPALLGAPASSAFAKSGRSMLLWQTLHLSSRRKSLALLARECRQSYRASSRAKAAAAADTIPRRFSAMRLAAHRKKLGLSAAAHGKLIGMRGATMYLWSRAIPDQAPSNSSIWQQCVLSAGAQFTSN
jgi:hypothetical protein